MSTRFTRWRGGTRPTFIPPRKFTQAVFVILATKAKNLSPKVVLSGWLYQTARLTAMTFIRGEIRRARREEEAHMQTLLNQNDPDQWHQIAPLLDAAMSQLGEADRHAVVLRYFDGKSLREVGAALGSSEDAAKMRLGRAVEKLRRILTKRGVALSAAGLAAAISANSVQAAPAILAKTATAVALAKGGTASVSTLSLIHGTLRFMAWTKARIIIVSAVALILVAGTAGKIATMERQGIDTPEEALRRLAKSNRTDYFPRWTWAFAGYANPKSTVMSCLWAIREKNSGQIMACLTLKAANDSRQNLSRLAEQEGKPLNEILIREVSKDFTKNQGFVFLDETAVSEGQVAVHLYVPDDVHNEYAFLMRKTGHEWKIDDFQK
jgi:RNA polymerase sigma factor (sigma-70 family)